MRPALAVGALLLAAAGLAPAVAATASGVAIAMGPDPSAGVVTGGLSDIPAPYLGAAVAAGRRFGVPWAVVAGIYKVECDFGRSQLPGCPRGTRNAFGAQGPGQFLPGTWRAGLALASIIQPGPPAAQGRGAATDGDGDGVADPWDPADAVASTARLLAESGSANDLAGAVFAYNHDATYVHEVLGLAASYERGAATTMSPGTVSPGTVSPGAVAEVLAFAGGQLGTPYLWGGHGPGGWDCSGLVQAAFAAVGVHLSHDAAAQYTATSGRTVPLGDLHPGDLVFYGTSPATIHHVGIAIDATRMLDAPHTGAVVRIDPVAADDLLAATRPLG